MNLLTICPYKGKPEKLTDLDQKKCKYPYSVAGMLCPYYRKNEQGRCNGLWHPEEQASQKNEG